MCSSCRNRGFTLLELLVALALLGLLAAALYGTYFSLMGARDRASAVAEETAALRTTLDDLRRELAAAYWRSAVTGEDKDKPRFRFVVEDRDFFGKPASILTLTTLAAPYSGTAPLSDQQLVEYRPLAKGEVMDLMRRQRDVYLDAEQSPVFAVMEGLQGFLVECYDGNKWVRNWDARLNGNRLPQQVRVTIRVKDGERVVPYQAVVSPQVPPS